MKLGFIDYYLDEWHANNYPQWIAEASDGKIRVEYAYGKIKNPQTGMTSAEWCEKNGVTLCGTVEELVDKSDGILVLAPDNSEQHEALSEYALKSGKPVFIDKTFAPDLAAARRIFALAEENRTPCYTTSALRYAEEYSGIDKSKVNAVNLFGPYGMEIYSIHILEPLCMLMQEQATRVMAVTSKDWYSLDIQFESGRCAVISQFGQGIEYRSMICKDDGNLSVKIESDFFHGSILNIIDFMQTGEEKVSHTETLRIMAIRDAGMKAIKKPNEWIPVETV